MLLAFILLTAKDYVFDILYIHVHSFCQELSFGTMTSDLVTLSLDVDTLKKQTLAAYFKPWWRRLWYFTSWAELSFDVLTYDLVTLTSELDHLTYFWKTLTMAIHMYLINHEGERFEISHLDFLWELSFGTLTFDLVTVTLKFDLLFMSFNIGFFSRPWGIWLRYFIYIFLMAWAFKGYRD